MIGVFGAMLPQNVRICHIAPTTALDGKNVLVGRVIDIKRGSREIIRMQDGCIQFFTDEEAVTIGVTSIKGAPKKFLRDREVTDPRLHLFFR